MRMSDHAVDPIVTFGVGLAFGCALGWGAASLGDLDASGVDAEASPSATATLSRAPAALKAPEPPPAVRNPPVAVAIDPPQRNDAAIETLSTDITLAEKVDATRREAATMEPAPEELAGAPSMDRAADPPDSASTDNLEHDLRMQSDSPTAQVPSGAGLLKHEVM